MGASECVRACVRACVVACVRAYALRRAGGYSWGRASERASARRAERVRMRGAGAGAGACIMAPLTQVRLRPTVRSSRAPAALVMTAWWREMLRPTCHARGPVRELGGGGQTRRRGGRRRRLMYGQVYIRARFYTGRRGCPGQGKDTDTRSSGIQTLLTVSLEIAHGLAAAELFGDETRRAGRRERKGGRNKGKT